MKITIEKGVAVAVSENNTDVERLIALAMVRDPGITRPEIRRKYRVDRSPRSCDRCGKVYRGSTGLGAHKRWCNKRGTRLPVQSV